MDFHCAMETFAEAWVAANTQTPLTEAVETTHHHHQMTLGGMSSHENPDRTFTSLSNSRSANLRHDEYMQLKAASQAIKSVPVHCVIEQVPNPLNHSENESTRSSPCSSSGGAPVQLDSYAIIAACTPFNDIVKSALLKLGYASSEVVGSKGAIQIHNWRPLPFDAITQSSEATVGEILGHVAGVATLRIKIYRTKQTRSFSGSSAVELKEKLLQILLAQSQTLLLNEGCPIDQRLLYALSTGCLNGEIPKDLQIQFENWYQQQVCKLQQQFICAALAKAQENLASSSSDNSTTEDNSDSANNNRLPTRTRLRTSFDTELELPLLNRWFGDNPHPNRCQIQLYVKRLNELESRRGRKPLDVTNVVYWFKNARAAHKRAEQRATALRSGDDNQDFNNNADVVATNNFRAYEDRKHDCESDEASSIENVKSELTSCDGSEEENVEIGRTNSGAAPIDQKLLCQLNVNNDIRKPTSFGQSVKKLIVVGKESSKVPAACLFDLGRRKRNRTFIDPISEVPVLERWFCVNSHPPLEHVMRYTAELNRQPYRHKFPKLEARNVQFWFKNRRAKSKRLKLTIVETYPGSPIQ